MAKVFLFLRKVAVSEPVFSDVQISIGNGHTFQSEMSRINFKRCRNN